MHARIEQAEDDAGAGPQPRAGGAVGRPHGSGGPRPRAEGAATCFLAGACCLFLPRRSSRPCAARTRSSHLETPTSARFKGMGLARMLWEYSVGGMTPPLLSLTKHLEKKVDSSHFIL
jgi:hypothetical protein